MKTEMNPMTGAIIVVVIVVVLGWFLWRKTEAPGNDPGQVDAQWAQTEKWAKDHHVDLSKDPLLASQYYKHHPDEKMPAGFVPGGPGAAPAKMPTGGAAK